MHIHKWTKWQDTEAIVSVIFIKSSQAQMMQTRRCTKCNKLRVRRINVEYR